MLRQLNQAEVDYEGREEDQALELAEIERRLVDFWAVKQGQVKVPLAVGLLLRNKMVETRADANFSWQRQRAASQRYRITAQGKQFLTEAVKTDNRVA